MFSFRSSSFSSMGSFGEERKVPNSQTSSLSERSLSSRSSWCSSSLEGKLQLQSELVHRCLATLRDHLGLVPAVAADGEFLYSSSLGKSIRVWQLPSLSECGRFGCGEGPVKAILVCGETVFCAHQDHKISVWKRTLSAQGTIIHILVATLPTLKDYLKNCVSKKNYVQVRRHHKSLWIQHVDAISVLAMGKNKLVIYSGSWDKTFKVWRLSDFKCIESMKAHDDAVNALVVGPDEFVYTASADRTIKVWLKHDYKKEHTLINTLEGHNCSVNALALSSDGSTLYSGGSDSAIIVWSKDVCIGTTTGQMRMTRILKGHRLSVLCLCMAGNRLISGSADKTVRVWRPSTENNEACLAVLQGHTGPVKAICASSTLLSGHVLYCASLDKSIKVWWICDEDEHSTEHASSCRCTEILE
eukprot:c28252_g1_i1 orf=361-1605(-)